MQEEKLKVNYFKSLEVIILLVLTTLLSVSFGVFIGNKLSGEKVATEEIPPQFNKLINTYNNIKENYYKEVNDEELVNAAIEGMIESLGDKHTTYLDKNENDNFQIQVRGNYIGVGITLTNTIGGNIVVTSVFEDSPAKKSGIEVMDIITKVDELDLTDKTSTEFVNYVKNSDNREFMVTLKRDEEILTKKITKELIEIKSVDSDIIEKNNLKFGYIKVDIFAANTYEQFKKELEDLEKKEINSLIIDLRDNTGGHLSVVEKMISLFLDSTHVIYQTEVKGKREVVYSTGVKTTEYPIIIIANENSASASEVMIGALKEEYNATFVGTKTYGKGTVQGLINITEDESYKFTTKKWLLPSGKWVDETSGIEPDILIEQSELYFETYERENDLQLNAALDLFIET